MSAFRATSVGCSVNKASASPSYSFRIGRSMLAPLRGREHRSCPGWRPAATGGHRKVAGRKDRLSSPPTITQDSPPLLSATERKKLTAAHQSAPARIAPPGAWHQGDHP